MMGVYEIINLANGKMTSYVGSSVDVKKRWQQHMWALRNGQHHNLHLQNAWDKYGEGAFSFCVLEKVNSEIELLDREQFYLDRAFGIGGTYNIARDATMPTLGLECSKETKRKIGEANKGRQPWLGCRLTEETKRKISEALMGKELSEGRRRKISGALKGRRLSEEHRRKIGEAYKRWAHSEGAWQKMSKARAKPYPAFVHRETGQVIPGGKNLAQLCRECGLDKSAMCAVKNGRRVSHQGWALADNTEVKNAYT